MKRSLRRALERDTVGDRDAFRRDDELRRLLDLCGVRRCPEALKGAVGVFGLFLIGQAAQ